MYVFDYFTLEKHTNKSHFKLISGHFKKQSRQKLGNNIP